MVDHRKTSYSPEASLDSVKSQLALCTPKTKVTYVQSGQVAAKSIEALAALTETLGKLDDIEAKKPDTRTMTEPSDYRHELALRDEQLKREMDIRHENARQEQVARDKALDDRLSAFMATQAEREKALDNQLSSFYTAQAERDKALEARIAGFNAAQAERDKRLEDISARATKAAESAATVKANYWAAVVVQLLAVVAIVVGAYFALHQSNQSVAQTVQSSYQMGREDGRKEDSKPPLIPANK